MREIAVRSAIESWKFIAEHSKATTLLPLDHSILHAAKMAEIAFSDEKLTPEQLAYRLKEVSALMDTLAEHAKTVGRRA